MGRGLHIGPPASAQHPPAWPQSVTVCGPFIVVPKCQQGAHHQAVRTVDACCICHEPLRIVPAATHCHLSGCLQAILVRDEGQKATLRQRVGSGPLILTAHECKGLEFKVRSWPASPDPYLLTRCTSTALSCSTFLFRYLMLSAPPRSIDACLCPNLRSALQQISKPQRNCRSTYLLPHPTIAKPVRNYIYMWLSAVVLQVVLVHGFFTTSPNSVKWRLVYGWLREQGLITDAEARSARYAHPKFDPQVRIPCGI